VLNRLKETLLNELVAGGPVLGTSEPSTRENDLATGEQSGADPAATARLHPEPGQLEGFIRGGLPRPEARAIVRHLLRGCDECRVVVRQVWALGNRKSVDPGNEPVRKTS
jgi:hypothetical protein